MKAPVKKKRGRPKSEATLERERVEEMLKSVPEHRRMTPTEKGQMQALSENLDQLKKEILKDYPTPIPRHLAYEMASLGDESMEGHEQDVLRRYEVARSNNLKNLSDGTTAKENSAAKRRVEILLKNEALINKIGTRPYTANHVAKKILKEWYSIPLGGRVGESSHLKKRGDDEKCPSIRTLTGWIASTRKPAHK